LAYPAEVLFAALVGPRSHWMLRNCLKQIAAITSRWAREGDVSYPRDRVHLLLLRAQIDRVRKIHEQYSAFSRPLAKGKAVTRPIGILASGRFADLLRFFRPLAYAFSDRS
jgi:hypothetical protein